MLMIPLNQIKASAYLIENCPSVNKAYETVLQAQQTYDLKVRLLQKEEEIIEITPTTTKLHAYDIIKRLREHTSAKRDEVQIKGERSIFSWFWSDD